MEKMVSSIQTRQIDYNRRKAITEAFQGSQRQQTRFAAPSISVRGVPGEYDHRKFITPAMSGFVPVQTGAAGGTIVGSIAVTTNPLQWREYDPGHFEGPFAKPGEKDSKPYYWTNFSTDPVTPPEFTPDPVAPTRAVTTERTSARVFSVSIVQDKEQRS
jgi:hypothetical protein